MDHPTLDILYRARARARAHAANDRRASRGCRMRMEVYDQVFVSRCKIVTHVFNATRRYTCRRVRGLTEEIKADCAVRARTRSARRTDRAGLQVAPGSRAQRFRSRGGKGKTFGTESGEKSTTRVQSFSPAIGTAVDRVCARARDRVRLCYITRVPNALEKCAARSREF